MNIAKMMTPKACTICLQATDSVRQGLEIMQRHGYTAIPVLDAEGCYLGCVTEGDFLKHLLATGSADVHDHERCRIQEILRRDFCPALGIFASANEVTDAIMKQNFVPIVDDRGCLCGILTRRAVISCLAGRDDSGTSADLPLIWE